MRVNIERTDIAGGGVTLLGGAEPGVWPAPAGTWGLAGNGEGLDGWYDSADPRMGEPVENPAADGAFWPEEIRMRARVLTVRGFYSTFGSSASEITLGAARDVVSDFVGSPLRVTVSDEVGDRFVTGYVASRVVFERISDYAFYFTLIIQCPDPVKYGPPMLVEVPAGAATVDIENNGRAFVSPVYQARSAIPSLLVEGGGARFEWSGASALLTLDLLEGVPRNSAGTVVGTVVRGEAIRVPPGKSTLKVTASKAGYLTLRAGWL